MTNLVASRPTAGGGGPTPRPASRTTLIGIAGGLVLLVGIAVATGNGIYLLGAAGFVVALLVSVTLHEAGHFLTARRYGMKATQFFCGFGPTLWSRQRGETEYGIKAIPAGGFVKIVGMTQLEEVDPADEPRAFWRQPARQRAVVLAAGSTVHFILAALLVLLASFTIGKVAERSPGIGAVSACVPTSVAAVEAATPRASAPRPHATPGRSKPSRPSSEMSPGPSSASAVKVAISTALYSSPPLAFHAPFGRCTVRMAVAMTPMSAAAAAGVASPSTRSAPPAVSVTPAA